MARSRSFILALAAGLGLACPAMAAAPPRAGAGLLGAPPLLRTFQDWILACDNTRICRAQPKSMDGSLMIRRDPGPAGTVHVVLDGQDPSAASSIPDPASIAVQGANGNWAARWRLDRGREAAMLDGAEALRFVRAIADAATLTYRVSGAELGVSLRGLKAALLAMDVAQGRVNGVTAFTRIGPRPAGAVLPALAVPILRIARPPAPSALPRAFAAAVRRANPRLLAHAECVSERWGGDQGYALNGTEAIVMLECLHGTHSTSYLLLRVRRSAPRRAAIIVLPRAPAVEHDYEDNSGLYPDVEWDLATATLSSSSYSCAHTCGDNLAWAFDGRAFRIAAYMTYEGGGAESLDVYRTEVRVGR